METRLYAMKMAIDRAVIFLCCLLVISFTSSAKRKKKQRGKYIHPFSDEAYETMLSLVQGTFNVPVAERTSRKTPSFDFGATGVDIILALRLHRPCILTAGKS